MFLFQCKNKKIMSFLQMGGGSLYEPPPLLYELTDTTGIRNLYGGVSVISGSAYPPSIWPSDIRLPSDTHLQVFSSQEGCPFQLNS